MILNCDSYALMLKPTL